MFSSSYNNAIRQLYNCMIDEMEVKVKVLVTIMRLNAYPKTQKLVNRSSLMQFMLLLEIYYMIQATLNTLHG